MITIDIDLDQETDLTYGGSYSSSSVETMSDKLTKIAQQHDEALGRAVKFKASSSEEDVEFPELTTDAVIKVNDGGDGLEMGPTLPALSTENSFLLVNAGKTGFDEGPPLADLVANKAIVVNSGGDSLVMGPSTNEISNAQTYAEAAQTAKTAAELAKTKAETAQVAAELAETNAKAAQTAAELAETHAGTSEANALTYKNAAEAAKTAAETAKTAAETAKTAAQAAQTASETAKTAAELAETNAETAETNAAASAVTAAAQAEALIGTSTTSLLIAVASKTFTTQASKQFKAGGFVLAVSDAAPANYMHGQVTSYSGTTLVVNVTNIGGSGTLADWTISVSGSRGAVGAAGESGDTLPVVDTTGIAKGSVDATKIVRFEVGGLTTGTTRVLTVPDKDLTLVGTVDIPSDPAAGTAGLRTIGTGALQACAGNDARLSDARTANAITGAIVAQGNLKTSIGEVSHAGTAGANATLPGGEYGFYPQTKMSGTGARDWTGTYILGGAAVAGWTSYVTNIFISGNQATSLTVYHQQRYVTASGEVHWIFILRTKFDEMIDGKDVDGNPLTYLQPKGTVISTYQAPDHPCFGNGGKPLLVPHPFGNYDEAKHEIIVINPSLAEIERMELEAIVDDETKPDKCLLQIISENYEINEYEEVWPDIPVTVGLPKHIKDKKTGRKVLADYRFMKGDTIVEPIKKRIIKPDYIKVKSLKRK